MKKTNLILTIISISFLTNSVKAELNTSLKEYLNGKDLEKGLTQIYLLERCSAVYAYASGIVLKSDAVSSKNFIEISNNLLFKAVELKVIEEEKKLEEAQEESEVVRYYQKFIFNNLQQGSGEKIKVTKKMGYIISVEKAREHLENIFNKGEAT